MAAEYARHASMGHFACVTQKAQLDAERRAHPKRARAAGQQSCPANQKCQSRDLLASASVERLSGERKSIA